ncbi:MAG: hypothetical protein UZ19_OD1000150, partial [Parcubacteria bacterium OLB19]
YVNYPLGILAVFCCFFIIRGDHEIELRDLKNA